MKLFWASSLLLFGVSAGLLRPLPVSAQEADDPSLYRISDVSVDVTAEKPGAARDQGLLEAERQAFDQLANRLSTSGSVHRPDDVTLANMVQAFDIQTENPMAGRYIGTLSVQFKPSAVKAYFQKAGSGLADTKSLPLVVLPVTKQSGKVALWEAGAPWRQAWAQAAQGPGLVPLIVPPGDAQDQALFEATGALQAVPAQFAALATKYQAGGVLEVVLDADAATVSPTQPAQWTIAVRRFDAAGTAQGAVQNLSIPAPATDKDLARALSSGVTQVRQDIEKDWKQTAKALEGPASTLRVRAQVPSLAMWNDLKARLARVPGVSRVAVASLSRDAIEADIQFRGTVQALQGAFASVGIQLTQTPQGWVVSGS